MEETLLAEIADSLLRMAIAQEEQVALTKESIELAKKNMVIAKKSLEISLTTLKLSGADEIEEMKPLMLMYEDLHNNF